MWKQPHFIHRSGNLTDKHLDGIRVWSTVIHASLTIPRPLQLAHRLHPRGELAQKAQTSSSLSCSVWKCQILPSQTSVGKQSSLDWWKRWHNSLISSEPSKLLIQRIQTIGWYGARSTSHIFIFSWIFICISISIWSNAMYPHYLRIKIPKLIHQILQTFLIIAAALSVRLHNGKLTINCSKERNAQTNTRVSSNWH